MPPCNTAFSLSGGKVWRNHKTPMATKPNLTSVNKTECVGFEAPAQEHPWLRAYPRTVSWDLPVKPRLLGELLDQSVAAHGARPCTYFMGKRLSYAEIGALSDRAAKG